MTRATHRFLCVAALLAAIAMPAASFALTDPFSGAEHEYNVEINKGELVHLDRAASTVLVSNPNIADVQVLSPTLVSINGRGIGETTVIAVDKNDHEIMNAVVNVTHNLSKLNKALKNSMPNSGVQFDTVDGALVMKGSVASPLEAADVGRLATPFLQQNQSVINMLKVEGSDQVTLQVRVAEVSRTELKRFGINMESLLSAPGNFAFGLATGRDIIDNTTGTLTRSGLDSTLFTGFRSPRANINSVIDALEQQGLVKVLAEPNLTAMSGRAANFLAGGEFPVPAVDNEGSVTVTYRPFGVSLAFTPVVMSKEKISLSVAPEVSTLSQVGAVQASGFNIPSLATRRAQSTVELGSGETFAIAGLIQNDTSNDISKFPGLGDVPILGPLFRSSEFRHDQTELVILVTPYIVKPVKDKTLLATPVDGLESPSDFDRILWGSLYREQLRGGNAAPGAGGNSADAAAENTTANAHNQEVEQAALNKKLADKNTPRLNGPAGFIVK